MDERGRALVDKFLARTVAFDRAMMAEVRRHALPFLVLTDRMTVGDVADACLTRLGRTP